MALACRGFRRLGQIMLFPFIVTLSLSCQCGLHKIACKVLLRENRNQICRWFFMHIALVLNKTVSCPDSSSTIANSRFMEWGILFLTSRDMTRSCVISSANGIVARKFIALLSGINTRREQHYLYTLERLQHCRSMP